MRFQNTSPGASKPVQKQGVPTRDNRTRGVPGRQLATKAPPPRLRLSVRSALGRPSKPEFDREQFFHLPKRRFCEAIVPATKRKGAKRFVSARLIFANSEAFQNICDQRYGEIVTEALERRRVLLHERRQVRGRLVLLPKDVILVLVKNFSVAAV